MTLEAAETIVYESINADKCKIDCVSESGNYFIFGLASVDSEGNSRPLMMPPIGVNKKTGEKVALTPDRIRGEITSIKRIR